MYEVRFLEISQENIVKYVSLTRKLTDTETVGILDHLDAAGLNLAM